MQATYVYMPMENWTGIEGGGGGAQVCFGGFDVVVLVWVFLFKGKMTTGHLIQELVLL